MLQAAKRTAPYVFLTLGAACLVFYAIGINDIADYYEAQGADFPHPWIALLFGFGALSAGAWLARRKKASAAITMSVVVLCLTGMSWIGYTS